MPLINDVIAPQNQQSKGRQKMRRRLRRSYNRLATFTSNTIKKRYKTLLVLAGGVGVLLVATVIITGGPKTDFPADIEKKANFSIFYPDQEALDITVAKSTINYSKQDNGLSYEATVRGKKVVVSQQALPSIFDEKGVYAYKLNQARQFDSFDTSAGEVTLTRPSDLNGEVVAWDKSKDTLILARTTDDMRKADWKLLFDSMVVVN